MVRPKKTIPRGEARRVAAGLLAVALGVGVVAAEPPLTAAPGGPMSLAVASAPVGPEKILTVVSKAPAQVSPSVSGVPVQATRTRFPSGRDQVAVEVFSPITPGLHPAVVLLHGARPQRAMRYYRELADDLARRGFMTLAVHYYERGPRGRGSRSDWRRSLSDAVTYAASLDGVDPDRVGVLGFSLGAFLALEQAPRDPRLRAVVAFYGGLSRGVVEGVESEMPPTLLVHGGADRVVPAVRSLDAAEMLRSAGCESDVVIYPKVRHGFGLNSRGGLDGAAARDAWERAVAFLGCHLWPPMAEGDGRPSCPSWDGLATAPVPALLNPSRDEVRRAAVSPGQRSAGG